MIAIENPVISVNGIVITQAQVDEELQSCSADELQGKDRYAAVRTLVIRELLLQEAIKWGLCDRILNKPEEAIERLLTLQIKVPAPDEATCKRYFQDHQANFSTAPLCEASHIFFSAPLGEQEARNKIKDGADIVLAKVKGNPACFGEAARQHSACYSAASDGSLGRIAKGQTVPAFESALMAMSKGDISEQLVETEVGFHIIRMDERSEGENLPFEVLKSWIYQYLTEQRRNKAIDGYVRGLADKATISGFEFDDEELD